MIKIAINAGHTINGKGKGAVGYINESEETRKVVSVLIPLLEAKGFNVVNATVDTATTQSAYLRKAVEIANKSKADLFVSIHFNAGGGNGCEAYTWKGEKVKQAVKICDNLSKEGFRNRGVKNGSSFYVVRNTTMTAILVEICFVDNKRDCDMYKKVGVAKIAQAIADAIS